MQIKGKMREKKEGVPRALKVPVFLVWMMEIEDSFP